MKLNINNINIFLNPNFIFLLLNYQNILINHSSIHTKNNKSNNIFSKNKSNSQFFKIKYGRSWVGNKLKNLLNKSNSKSGKNEEFLSLKNEELLLDKQIENFDKILKELKKNDGKKITHWIWYVFPTTKKDLMIQRK